MFNIILSNKKTKLIFWTLLLVGLIYFEFVGQIGAIEFDDSNAYIAQNIRQGVMPLYHFFLTVLRVVNAEYYLQLASVIQGVLASFCVSAFTCYLVETFNLTYIDSVLVWLTSLLPFSVEMPKYVSTHVINTEGIAYAVFYLYIILAFECIKLQTYSVYTRLFTISLIMSLIRPQLLLLFIITGGIGIYLVWIDDYIRNIVLRILSGITLFIVTIVVGVITTFFLRSVYIYINSPLNAEAKESSFDIVSDNDDNEEYSEGWYRSQQSSDQLGAILILRGMYEADSDDIELYTKDYERLVFKLLQAKLEQQQLNYKYNPGGLYGWEHITKTEIYQTYSELLFDPEILSSDLAIPIYENSSRLSIKLGIVEILRHPLRFTVHCLMLMVPGFISCIFFNIERIYLLCHIIVVIIYGIAIAMTMYLAQQKLEQGILLAKYMKLILFAIIVFVGVTNTLFFGMQRYFLYMMGCFYAIMYVEIRYIINSVIKK